MATSYAYLTERLKAWKVECVYISGAGWWHRRSITSSYYFNFRSKCSFSLSLSKLGLLCHRVAASPYIWLIDIDHNFKWHNLILEIWLHSWKEVWWNMSNWMIAKENILNLGSSSLFVKTPKMRDCVINSKSVYRHLYAFKIIHVYMIKFGSNFYDRDCVK